MDFLTCVTDTLNDLAEQCEAQLPEKAEVDLQDASLEIISPSGQVWLLNRHAPSQELWLSSPVSGGFHFRYHSASAQWRATRASQDDLYAHLSSELGISLLPSFSAQ